MCKEKKEKKRIDNWVCDLCRQPIEQKLEFRAFEMSWENLKLEANCENVDEIQDEIELKSSWLDGYSRLSLLGHGCQQHEDF